MRKRVLAVLCFSLGILALAGLSGCRMPTVITTSQPAPPPTETTRIATAAPSVPPSGYPNELLPQTVSPPVSATNVPARPIFQWPLIQGALSYDFQLADNTFYTNPIDSQSGLTATVWEEAHTLEPGKTYYWRFRGVFTSWVEDWITSAFTTAPQKSVIHGDLMNGRGGAGDRVVDSGATNVSVNPVFEWPAMKGAVSYDFQLADNPVFNNPWEDLKGISTTSWSELHTLQYDHSYYWGYRAEYSDGTVSNWLRGLFYTIPAPISTTPSR